MSFSCGQSLDGSCPPSPLEDRSSKRLSWSSLLQKVSDLQGLDQLGSSTETGSSADMSMDSDTSSLWYSLEENIATEVMATITQSLYESSHVLGCFKLILPDCLLHNISQELIHLADSEPCGLRGALIDLCVESGDQGLLCTLDQIAVDATLVPTFHVTLVLRLESGGLWQKVQKLFKDPKSSQTHGSRARARHSLRLKTTFRAIKRKLYSSGELLVEEC
ncbi:DNA damage-inducible transcript 4 protein-like [Thalassophryne amazonica]|uniref:DNA damage-inducible transcript 4 protein-like n=1 Tax=Thalassophryne amazonica TaxID=390379 RepID=UPI0014710931|nr:DNA damage-inducible transcript 4 protein-like [Thalassophryne amazonica]